MEHPEDARRDVLDAQPSENTAVAHDRRWAGNLHSAVRCAAALLLTLFLIDWGAGSLSWWRSALWVTLAWLLFVVLFPARVRAGEGWLSSRRLLRTRRVRTDLLVSVRCLDGVAQRLVLRDSFGERVEIDPQVLVDNPDLWYRLDEDARKSESAGILLCGTTALHRVSERIDRVTAQNVFRASGLE
ncbi:hypothetical protein [Streptomyces brasiliensis]|uniref:Uncharacterized protein n=1 Tax=Streptomyces brasiliensis TaxID=1954 RepID=A0A917LE26_9ACTN|nr:hypothetical protein [Streptomyces brasiliensis]GGJ56856.1 hypothetical protein GCM10010121_079450 [Streptomyces brasiliensis]